MMNIDFAKARNIFLEATEKVDNHDANAFLDVACGNDEILRQHVNQLLEAHQMTGGFLEQGAILGSHSIQPVITEHLGTLIGPYKILEQIGEGGMGTVYVAEQKDPVRRKVALKLIKPGMDSHQVVARFEAERQALAMMNHPNIAKVLDVGTTAAGRPYFAMELVKGTPITEFCDEHKLNTRDRLQLFITVCQAVQHAHQKGLIHRDLKPSNVLVEIHDVKPVPKVIDFGVAKAIGQQLTDKTLHTGISQMIGTPLYMSPEQAGLSSIDVDTRSDIYSLGVLLYEILTGHTPFESETLRKAGFDEMRRLICEVDPPRPSTRISTLEAQTLSTVSESRKAEPHKLSQQLRGELDWIVMKTLEKDRNRRYESASALAADVQRYLNDEPVQACPPSASYRFSKFARRNKAALTTSIFVAAILIIGIGVSTWQAVRATLAESKADIQLNLARKSDIEARRQATEAVRQRDETLRQESLVVAREESLRRYLYASDMKLAWSLFQKASNSNELNHVRNLLSRYEPSINKEDLRSFAWCYMERLCAETVSSTLRSHDGKVYHTAISPDGATLASAGQDGTAKIWDLSTSQLRHTLRGHASEVNCVAFAPDGKTLATASDDMSVKFWDVDSGQERFAPTLIGLNLPVHRVEWSSDGKLLVTSELSEKRDSGKTTVWDLPSGLKQRELVGHFALALSPDGRILATTNWDKVVRLWDIASGQERTVLRGHTEIVLTGMFSRDSTLFATGSNDMTVRIWNLDEGLEKMAFNRFRSNAVHSVAWSPDQKLLAMGYEDGETHLWEPKSRCLLGVLKSGSRVRAVRFTPDGKTLASASDDGTIRLFECSAANAWASPPDQPSIVTSISFSADSELLATSNGLREGRLWSVVTGDSMTFPPNQSDQGVCCMAFSPTCRTLAIGRFDGTVNLVDPITGDRRIEIVCPQSVLKSLIYSPDGKMLAGKFSDRAIRVWDTRFGNELHSVTFPHHVDFPESNAFSPDGMTLALHLGDIVKRLDTNTWQLRALENRLPRELYCLTYAPDGHCLAIGSSKQIEFWDTATDEQTAILLGLDGDVKSSAFAPDGRTLASGSSTGELKLWDWATKQELLSLAEHTGSIDCIAFSPDGKTLASAGAKPDGRGEIRFWHTAMGTSKK